MARIIPQDWQTLAAAEAGSVGQHAATLARLERGLSDAYTVYHAVHWSHAGETQAIFDEIDFIVVNPGGDLLLIEQKNGFLTEGPEGLVTRHPGGTRLVPVRLAAMVGALRERLARRRDIPPVAVEALFHCPHHTVRHPDAAGVCAERVVDAGRREQLCAVIRALLPEGEANPAAAGVHAFLRDLIRLEPDVSALLGQAEALVTRVAGGLAQWARQLEFSPYRLRVVGTAGSGKTQLALAEYRASVAAGLRPLYVCFNRPLAEHFRRIAPAGGMVCSFHQLCDALLRAHGGQPDYQGSDPFAALERAVETLAVPEALRFDTVIVDEGQDFSAGWGALVLRHARAEARLLWLEDPLQDLYGRPPASPQGWVTLHARANFRSPRPVVRLLQALLPEAEPIEAASPVAVDDIDWLTYRDTEGLRRGVKEALRRCYAAGYRKGDVAIVSFRGRAGSALIGLDRLGATTLRRFAGGYDLSGQPVYTEGEVLVETVYRFKGQAAPAVILAEVDWERLDERARRKLFVGATRARFKLAVVAHERAAADLAACLGAAWPGGTPA